ncbi:MAG: hypothetical protein M3P96_10280, partial [Actinomycetota bacterium]|nr:hypothetical protein [Actinomycetota bacterium]
MSTPLPPLPDFFVSHGVRLGDARAAGLTRSELDGPLWVRPHRGLRQWSAASPSTWTRVAAAGALLPPGGALGGWAAAYLLDAGGADGEAAGGAALPVPLLLPPPLQLRPRPGLLRWHSPLAPD